MKMTMKIIAGLGLLAVVAAAGTTASRAEDTLEKLKAQGYATIGIANEPPFSEVKPDGTLTGAAPDVAKAVMAKLGVPEVRYQIVDYGAMIPGLEAGRFDFIAAGLYINPKRCESISFSEPDVCGSEAFAVETGNPLGLKTYEDIAKAGITMATCGGCAEYDYAKKAGVSEANIVVAPDPQSGLKMLQSGRVKVYALGGPVIHELVTKANDPKLEIVNPVEGVPPSCAGAGFRKGDEAFRKAYDEALKDLKGSDAFPPLVDSYGFSSVVAKRTTREQLCTASK